MSDAPLRIWVFVAEIPVPSEIRQFLAPGEQPRLAYRGYRDWTVFTDRRFIVRDAQGMTGNRTEMFSLPHAAVNAWSIRDPGPMNLASEVNLWTSPGFIKVSVDRRVNLQRLTMALTHALA